MTLNNMIDELIRIRTELGNGDMKVQGFVDTIHYVHDVHVDIDNNKPCIFLQ